MTSQKNKIIIIIIVILIISLGVWGLATYHNKTIVQPSASTNQPTNYNYYQKCKSYLGQIQTLADGRKIIPPQVFCRVTHNNTVSLIPNDKVAIHPGDFIVEVIDIQRLFNQKYFDNLQTNERLLVPKGPFTLCLSQSSSQGDKLLHIFPEDFNTDLLSRHNLTAACLSRATVYSLQPIGILKSFSSSPKAKFWRVGLYLPPSNLYNAPGIHAESILTSGQNFHLIYNSTIPIQ